MLSRDVSVVIPAYNAENFVIDALESIVRQTCLPREVLVVDDGSSDQTFQVVSDWIATAVRPFSVRLIHQANSGISAARNAAIRHAHGEWTALLDADDVWEPQHLAELTNASHLVGETVAVYGAGRLLVGANAADSLYDDFWDNPSKVLGSEICDSPCLKIDATIFPRLIKGNFIKPSSLMFRTAVALEIGIFDESLPTGEDREFLVRLIFKGCFVYYPKSITLYRWHDNNASQTKNARRNLENGLHVLNRIICNKSLGLGPRQLKACHAEVRTSITAYLYVCSLGGWKVYANGLGVVRSLFGEWSALTALNPKHLAHTLTA